MPVARYQQAMLDPGDAAVMLVSGIGLQHVRSGTAAKLHAVVETILGNGNQVSALHPILKRIGLTSAGVERGEHTKPLQLVGREVAHCGLGLHVGALAGIPGKPQYCRRFAAGLAHEDVAMVLVPASTKASMWRGCT